MREVVTKTVWTCYRCAYSSTVDGEQHITPIGWVILRDAPVNLTVPVELCEDCSLGVKNYLNGIRDEPVTLDDTPDVDEIIADVADQARKGQIEKRATEHDETYRKQLDDAARGGLGVADEGT